MSETMQVKLLNGEVLEGKVVSKERYVVVSDGTSERSVPMTAIAYVSKAIAPI